MNVLTPILLPLLFHQGASQSPLCHDLSYYQTSQSGGNVYRATPGNTGSGMGPPARR
ncbi:hypothetical protein [Desulfogranum japonicum]|uniref:hypothetical protein n=1 Tax=Desulfogranum japonicum TaxID=231447 RepID=UPI0013770705|nr:hypothetical protein [Desulfogranum japonicum]